MNALKKYGIREDYFDIYNNKTYLLSKLDEALDWADKHGHDPHQNIHDKEELSLALFISRLRSAKNGKGRRKWFPELEKAATLRGREWFKNRDTKKIALYKFLEAIVWSKKNHKKPSHHSANCVEQKYGALINRIARAKRSKKFGKGHIAWYPEYDIIANKHHIDWLKSKNWGLERSMTTLKTYCKRIGIIRKILNHSSEYKNFWAIIRRYPEESERMVRQQKVWPYVKHLFEK